VIKGSDIGTEGMIKMAVASVDQDQVKRCVEYGCV